VGSCVWQALSGVSSSAVARTTRPSSIAMTPFVDLPQGMWRPTTIAPNFTLDASKWSWPQAWLSRAPRS
jgi:hypothetical protein